MPSYIDSVFSLNFFFVKNSGLEQSNCDKCHRNIIFRTINFSLRLPSPYYREIWYYKNAAFNSTQKAISTFDSRKAFKDRNAHENRKILTDTLTNIFANFISHKTRKFDYKTPKWMDKSIISSLKKILQ